MKFLTSVWLKMPLVKILEQSTSTYVIHIIYCPEYSNKDKIRK